MALVNYSLPFGSSGGPTWATISPLQSPPHATAVNSLLYGPPGQNDLNNNFYKNGPYTPPEHIQRQQQQQQYRTRNNNYLPPKPAPSIAPPYQSSRNGYPQNSRTYGESGYSQPSGPSSATSYSNSHNNGFYKPPNEQSFKQNPYQPQQQLQTTKAPPSRTTSSYNSNSKNIKSNINNNNNDNNNSNNNNKNSGNFNVNQAGYPERPPGFIKVQAGTGSRTQGVAVLDYDDDENEYYDDDESGGTTGTGRGNFNCSILFKACSKFYMFTRHISNIFITSQNE